MQFQSTSSEEDVVSKPVLRLLPHQEGFNPRPPKRTLCQAPWIATCGFAKFQSTSSEEDVVSVDKSVFDPFISMFQSTSSEEDVVS